MKMTILITGGTGTIGTALSSFLLKQNYRVIILTREKRENINGLEYAQWNIEKNEIDKKAISSADAIIHLAGAGIADKRWSRKRKIQIRESRTHSSGLLVNALKEYPNNVKTVVSASAIGWYGPDKKKSPVPFTEDAPPNNDFLGDTCRLWEGSIQPVTSLQTRLVILRCGIVLSNGGGALKEFIKPLKYGIAPIFGSGKQIVSWIHIDDLCRIYLEAIKNEKLEGVYNAVTPEPCSNKKLMLQLGNTFAHKRYLPVQVPSFVLKLMLGEMSIELLKSATVSCRKIQNTGFQFLYPTIKSATEVLAQQSVP